MLKNTYINKKYYDHIGALNKVLVLRNKNEVKEVINDSLIPKLDQFGKYFNNYKNYGYFLSPNNKLFMIEVTLNPMTQTEVYDICLHVYSCVEDNNKVVFNKVTLELINDYINYLT